MKKELILAIGLVAVILILIVIISGLGFEFPRLDIQLKENDINHKIPSEELVIVEDLFSKNNINIENLQIRSFQIREKFSDNLKSGYYIIGTIRIHNGLPIFRGGDAIYHFNKEGLKVFENGSIYPIIGLIPDTPKISKEEALRILLEQQEKYLDSSNKFSIINNFAELGIVNKKVGIGYDNPDYTLVWKITVKDSKYPDAYISAIDGEVFSMDDGIRT